MGDAQLNAAVARGPCEARGTGGGSPPLPLAPRPRWGCCAIKPGRAARDSKAGEGAARCQARGAQPVQLGTGQGRRPGDALQEMLVREAPRSGRSRYYKDPRVKA